MRTIIVKIESADDVAVTAKTIEDKWNFGLMVQNQIKITTIPPPDSTTEDMKVKCENCEQTITPVRLGGFCPECFQDI